MRQLTSDKQLGYLVALPLMAASLLILLVPSQYLLPAAAFLFAVCAVLAYTFLKKSSIHSYNKNQVLYLVSVFVFVYLVLFYLSGLHFGYAASPAGRLTLLSFVSRVLPIAAVIFATEMIRVKLIAQRMKAVTFISYVIGIASEIVCAGGIPNFSSHYQLTDFLGTAVFPALISNLVFTYIARRYGAKPNIAYRLLLTLYAYLIPIVPNMPDMMSAFTLLIFPLIIFIFIDTYFEKKVRRATERPSKWRFVFPTVALTLMVATVMLISCQFRFGILVIASESMTGEIGKGDAVIFESYEHCDEPKEGDVIIYEENNRRVVHRVVKINVENGERQYITKGDANEGNDPGHRTDADIVGIVRLKILYIGYPSVWLRELFN